MHLIFEMRPERSHFDPATSHHIPTIHFVVIFEVRHQSRLSEWSMGNEYVGSTDDRRWRESDHH
jgi:hypothetical protein